MIDKAIFASVPPVIEKTVNGKIKNIQELLEGHLQQYIADKQEETDFREEMRPFIQAKMGGTFAFKGLIGLGSLAMSWVALKQLFPSI